MEKCLDREALQEKDYGQRKQDLLRKTIGKWKKQTMAKHNLINKYRGLNHYKMKLYSLCFEGFKRVFRIAAGTRTL